MTWIQEIFTVTRPIIGMVHLPALPGTPLFHGSTEVRALVSGVRADLDALQEGGVDGVLFCNENDRPYTLSVGPEVVAAMTRIIADLLPYVEVPFGVDVLWDPIAALAVAKATGARFVRGVFTGAYAGDFGIWNTDPGRVWRYRAAIGATDVKLFYNINAEFAAPLAPRPIETVARSAVMSAMAEVLCVSGSMTGEEVANEVLERVKAAVGEVPVLANTGVTIENVGRKLAAADGAIVGTGFKVDGVTWNRVDRRRVEALMRVVRALRQEEAGTEIPRL
jgi:membrane complex biogenesis BtpA family protein